MALLENLKPGQQYLVKVSASNSMGDGPFSHTLELTVRADHHHSSGHDPRFSHGSTGQSASHHHHVSTVNWTSGCGKANQLRPLQPSLTASTTWTRGR